jgi:hypothetical protein
MPLVPNGSGIVVDSILTPLTIGVAMMHQGSEMWTPRCPVCGSGTIILAPANGFTKHIIAQQEVYCTNCRYLAKLADDIKRIYIRV